MTAYSDRIISTVDSEEHHAEPAKPLEAANFVGHLALMPLSRERVLITTFLGRCLIVDVETGLARVQPTVAQGYVGAALYTPSVGLGDRYTCAVATRSSWAGVWDVGDEAVRRVYTETGPCNSVAVSPSGDLLAVGTGFYPLSLPAPRCGLEIWNVDGTPDLLSKLRLPDVAIDWIWWDEDLDRLLAWSGVATQDRGNLWIFDIANLRLLDSVALHSSGVHTGALVNSRSEVLTVTTNQLEVRSRTDLEEIVFQRDLPAADSLAISIDTAEVLLTSGELYSFVDSGSRSLEPLPGCIAVAARPGGGFLGLSKSGVLRTWD